MKFEQLTAEEKKAYIVQSLATIRSLDTEIKEAIESSKLAMERNAKEYSDIPSLISDEYYSKLGEAGIEDIMIVIDKLSDFNIRLDVSEKMICFCTTDQLKSFVRDNIKFPIKSNEDIQIFSYWLMNKMNIWIESKGSYRSYAPGILTALSSLKKDTLLNELNNKIEFLIKEKCEEIER